ncbi:keratin, type I cytoskeletal 19-like [Mixophyes fleayi]|uniref:keratin, type I cytoskeletal 19-like n=1 Tax=Mixophyes fleayi TaxID=3061075 RepID=UPI003F4DF9E2
MGYRTDLLSLGSNIGEDFVAGQFPMYKSHFHSNFDRDSNTFPNTAYIPHDVNLYRVHNFQGKFQNSHFKHSSSDPGCAVGNIHGVYRCHMKSSGDHTFLKNGNLLSVNEKKTMQSLNGRLASYLENVKSLDEENVMLEEKICEWYKNNTGNIYPDSSQYFQIISDLQNQVLSATTHNASLIQQIDGDHIVADDFRKKYEMELRKRTSTEEDICNHCGILKDINMDSQALTMQIQYLEEELLQLKKQSQEEITCLQSQLGTRVKVEVETSPCMDLNTALSEIRKEYESLMERNLRDVEKQFHEMSSEVSCKVFFEVEQMLLLSKEVTDLKLCVHTLEIELRKQLNMISAHECTLSDLNEHYSSHLNQLQAVIDIHESQLTQIQSKLKQQNYKCKMYMDVKIRLEKEMNMFQHLLEGHDAQAPINHPTQGSDGKWDRLPRYSNTIVENNHLNESQIFESMVTKRTSYNK